jgi:hypothetical protein
MLADLPEIDHLRTKAAEVKGLRDGLIRARLSLQVRIQALEDEEELLELTGSLLRTLIDREVEAGVKAVEALQTEGLRAVFDDQDLSVKANVDIQRGKVSVDLLTVQKHEDGSITEGSPVDAFGGSVLTVQSILLRIIVMMRRDLRRFILLDETLPAFDSNYISNMGAFLSELCKRLGIDILMVTHNPVLFESADRSYRIVQRGGEATFDRVR